jgi:8-oxo-dGTP pyrophosphatase MutT (NUDIX family)
MVMAGWSAPAAIAIGGYMEQQVLFLFAMARSFSNTEHRGYTMDDTWGIPGGARDSHEEIFDAAAREGHEECGIEKDFIRPIETYVDDHGDWAYWTVICKASEDVEAHHVNDEALQLSGFLRRCGAEKSSTQALQTRGRCYRPS